MSNILPPPWPWTSNFKRNPPLQMITNQLKENKIQGWLFILSGPSFRSAFVFSIKSLILSGFPLTSFHLVEASLSSFSWLYTLVCAVVQKYHEMYFIYNYSHFYYSFCNQPVLFAPLENVIKLWNHDRTVHVNERNQNKNKTKHVAFKLITSSIVWFCPQTCNGIIEGWLHWLTSVSKRRFLVNNILMFGSAWCLVMVQIQFSLIKKLKIGRPEHSVTPAPYVR